MKMIKTDKLVFEYAKRDEEGNIIGMSRAVDEVDLDIEPGQDFLHCPGVLAADTGPVAGQANRAVNGTCVNIDKAQSGGGSSGQTAFSCSGGSVNGD